MTVVGGDAGAWVSCRAAHELRRGRFERILCVGELTSASGPADADAQPEGPQAHLVLQGAGTEELPVHFHEVEQFQVFLEGAGRVGRRDVGASTVHYTDRLTPYGPLTPGPPGMAYVTLRPAHEPRPHHIPEHRAELAERLVELAHPERRRNRLVELATVAGPPGAFVDVCDDEDGLRVAVAQVGSGDALEEVTASGNGAFQVVVAGALEPEAGEDPPLPLDVGTLRWCPPGGVLPTARASVEGARVALVQFSPPLAPPA